FFLLEFFPLLLLWGAAGRGGAPPPRPPPAGRPDPPAPPRGRPPAAARPPHPAGAPHRDRELAAPALAARPPGRRGAPTPPRPPPDVAVVTMLEHRADQDVGVVVAFLRPPAELARRVEQPCDRRDGVGAEEGELERPRRVERELVADVQVDDPLVVARRVEPQ